MDRLPTRDLGLYRPREVIECAGCGDPATEDDPQWRGETYHLLCLDMEDVREVVAESVDEALTGAAKAIAGAFYGEAEKAHARALGRVAYVKARQTCSLCRGAREVAVTMEPVPTFALCTCCGGEGSR